MAGAVDRDGEESLVNVQPDSQGVYVDTLQPHGMRQLTCQQHASSPAPAFGQSTDGQQASLCTEHSTQLQCFLWGLLTAADEGSTQKPQTL